MAGKMNFMKNLGKSVKLAGIDAFKEMNSNIVDAVKDNKEFVTSNYKAIKDYKESETGLRENKYYKSSKRLIENAIKEIKSGELYSKEKIKEQEEIMNEAFGFDLGGLDAMEDMLSDIDNLTESSSSESNSNSESFEDDEGNTTEVTNNNTINNNRVIMNTITNTQGTNRILASSSKAVLESLQLGNSTLISSINNIIEFQNDKTIQFYNDTSERLTSIANDINTLVTPYKDRTSAEKTSKQIQAEVARQLGYSNALSIEIYKDIFKANKSGNFDMFKMLAEDMGTTLEGIASNPMGFLLKEGMKSIIPKKMRGSMEKINDFIEGDMNYVMQGLFSNLADSDNKLFKTIGERFKLSTKKSVKRNFSKYERGPIPFDGETKRAITFQIPVLLGKILKSVSKGKEDIVYNEHTGQFIDRKDSERQFQDKFSDIKYNEKQRVYSELMRKDIKLSGSQNKELEEVLTGIADGKIDPRKEIKVKDKALSIFLNSGKGKLILAKYENQYNRAYDSLMEELNANETYQQVMSTDKDYFKTYNKDREETLKLRKKEEELRRKAKEGTLSINEKIKKATNDKINMNKTEREKDSYKAVEDFLNKFMDKSYDPNTIRKAEDKIDKAKDTIRETASNKWQELKEAARDAWNGEGLEEHDVGGTHFGARGIGIDKKGRRFIFGEKGGEDIRIKSRLDTNEGMDIIEDSVSSIRNFLEEMVSGKMTLKTSIKDVDKDATIKTKDEELSSYEKNKRKMSGESSENSSLRDAVRSRANDLKESQKARLEAKRERMSENGLFGLGSIKEKAGELLGNFRSNVMGMFMNSQTGGKLQQGMSTITNKIAGTKIGSMFLTKNEYGPDVQKVAVINPEEIAAGDPVMDSSGKVKRRRKKKGKLSKLQTKSKRFGRRLSRGEISGKDVLRGAKSGIKGGTKGLLKGGAKLAGTGVKGATKLAGMGAKGILKGGLKVGAKVLGKFGLAAIPMIGPALSIASNVLPILATVIPGLGQLAAGLVGGVGKAVTGVGKGIFNIGKKVLEYSPVGLMLKGGTALVNKFKNKNNEEESSESKEEKKNRRRNELIKRGLIATVPGAGLAYAGYMGAKALARKNKISEDEAIADKKIGKKRNSDLVDSKAQGTFQGILSVKKVLKERMTPIWIMGSNIVMGGGSSNEINDKTGQAKKNREASQQAKEMAAQQDSMNKTLSGMADSTNRIYRGLAAGSKGGSSSSSGGGSSSGDGNIDTSGKMSGNTVTQKVWTFLKTKGFTDQAAAGIMGNIYQESKFNPKLLQNGRGPAAGLIQMETYGDPNSRWGEMAKIAEKKGKPWYDLESQLEYLMKNAPSQFDQYTGKTPHVYSTGALAWWPEKMSFNQYKKVTDVDQATEIFSRVFERPSKPMMATRQKMARQYLKKYAGKTSFDDKKKSSEGKKKETPKPKKTTIADAFNKVTETLKGNNKPVKTASLELESDSSMKGASNPRDYYNKQTEATNPNRMQNDKPKGSGAVNAITKAATKAISKPKKNSGKKKDDKKSTSLNAFMWPLVYQKHHTISSNFGYRNISNGTKWHRGIDISAPNGSAILAPADGVVKAVGAEANKIGHLGGYGGPNVVVLQHDFKEGKLKGKWVTIYEHNRRFNVKKGQKVTQGDKIAEVGGLGQGGKKQYGYHLHFGIKRGTDISFGDPGSTKGWTNPLNVLQHSNSKINTKVKFSESGGSEATGDGDTDGSGGPSGGGIGFDDSANDEYTSMLLGATYSGTGKYNYQNFTGKS